MTLPPSTLKFGAYKTYTVARATHCPIGRLEGLTIDLEAGKTPPAISTLLVDNHAQLWQVTGCTSTGRIHLLEYRPPKVVPVKLVKFGLVGRLIDI
jgi:hypothetical protein